MSHFSRERKIVRADSPNSCHKPTVPRKSLGAFLAATRVSVNKNENRKGGCSCGCGCKNDCGCGCGGKGGCGCSKKKKKEKEKEKKKSKKYTEEDVIEFFVGTLRKSVSERNLNMNEEEFKKLAEKMWREMPLHVLEKVIELFEENAHSEMTTKRSDAHCSQTLVQSNETAACKTKKKYSTVKERTKWNVTEKCMKCKSSTKIANTRKKGKSKGCKRKATTGNKKKCTRQNAGTFKSKKAGVLKQKIKTYQSEKKNTKNGRATAKKHGTIHQVKKIVNSKKTRTQMFCCRKCSV